MKENGFIDDFETIYSFRHKHYRNKTIEKAKDKLNFIKIINLFNKGLIKKDFIEDVENQLINHCNEYVDKNEIQYNINNICKEMVLFPYKI